MSLQRLSKLVLVLALALLLSGLFTYIASPQIAERLAIHYLEGFDVTNVRIEIQRPGVRGIFIDNFEAQWQGFDIRLQSMQINYTAGGLFNRQIDAISLKQITAVKISGDDEKRQKTEDPAALFTWPEVLSDTLPGGIEISEILLVYADNKLTGNLSFSEKTLSMHGEINTSASFLREALQPYLKDMGVQEITGALTLKLHLQAPRQESRAIALEDIQISGSIIPDLMARLRVPEYENYSVLLNWNETSTIAVSSRHIAILPGPHISVSGPEANATLSIGALSAELMDYTRLISIGVSILPGASIKLENLLDPGDLELSTNTPLSITVNREAQSLGVKAAVLNLEISAFTYHQLPYYFHPLSIETPDIHLVWNEALNLTIELSNPGKTLSANMNIKADKKNVAINSQLSLNSQSSLIDELFSNWRHNFDISGSLSIDLIASLDFETFRLSDFSGDLTLEDSSLFYDDVSLGGVNLNMPFHLQDTQFATDWVSVKVDQANVGVELTNIEGSVRYSPSALNIGAFKTQLLGGEAHNNAMDYAFGSPSAHTRISFSNLQLPRLVALADDEVQASGVIDGSIRLSSLFGEDGSVDLVIEDGALAARPPGGYIKYRIGNQGLGLAQQSDIDFALTALENFNYHKLDSTVTLGRDGELKLGVSLLGSNPQVKDGRQIQYNLNIDQNLFTLLRSLQLNTKLSDRIGEKLTK